MTSSDPSRAATTARRGTTLQILGIVGFNFVGYLCVGLPLAVVPEQVHHVLGYGTVVAGLAVSLQYVATLLSRAVAGRTCDVLGPRLSVLYGLSACAASGVLLLAAAFATAWPGVGLGLLLLSRLVLGCGESLVTTGAITWGIGSFGNGQTGKVISWNGVTTYSALALAAPVGVWLAHRFGFAALGVATLLVALPTLWRVWRREGVAPVRGVRIPAREVLAKMLPFGTCLGLASVGFGAVTAFVALYYDDHGWDNAALAITLLGGTFVLIRLVLPNVIARLGGFVVAVASFVVEAVGLLLIWTAPGPWFAAFGAAVTGAGFSLVFPALGIEAVRRVSDSNRGTALGIYSLFLDLALAVTGPLAGFLAHRTGYGSIYLLAGVASLLAAALSLWMASRSGSGASRAVRA